MARIIPSDLTRLALSGAHAPEIETLAGLKERLPDGYTVFHGVHWTRQYRGHTLYGEIDFVVLNSAGSVLCIEQKNGPLIETGQGLLKDYGHAQKNVGDQIHRSLNGIREKFAFQVGRGEALDVEYLIYCPDHALTRVSAAGIDRERVVDAGARDRLAERILAILPDDGSPGGERFERIASFFCQTFDVVPDVHAHISAQQKNYTRLSQGLLEVLGNIEMAPLRLHVRASAGNGKTLVARHFFDQCIAAGGRPLLLCFNRPLAERLKRLVAHGGRVETWYRFCHLFLESRGITLDFSSMGTDPEFWNLVAREVADCALLDTPDGAWRFDALIIDEAQDFEGHWFEAVRLFLRDDADILWLEDPNQNIRGIDSVLLRDHGFVGYRSLMNYRTPERIARFVGEALPELELICANDLPGLGVGVTGYDEPTEQPRLIGRIVGRLLNQRFHPHDIAILSCRGLSSTALRDVERVGNRTLSRFTGEYDLFGNQVYSKGQILFDTVRRFKGQQAAAVVLTDVDPSAERLAQELMVLYCGLTRATVRLEILCRRDNPEVQRRLGFAL